MKFIYSFIIAFLKIQFNPSTTNTAASTDLGDIILIKNIRHTTYRRSIRIISFSATNSRDLTSLFEI